MATAATRRELIDTIAAEMSDGIQRAVNLWISEIEEVLDDPRLTTLGRLRAVQELIERYRASVNPGPRHDGYAA